jgi:hypothetical protein
MIYDNCRSQDLILLNRLLIFMKFASFKKSLAIMTAILGGSISVVVLGSHSVDAGFTQN